MSLIQNAMAPTRGFFDCGALYFDDELRKTSDHLIPFKILIAQEGAEGGSASIRNLRHDLYKDMISRPDIAPPPIREEHQDGRRQRYAPVRA